MNTIANLLPRHRSQLSRGAENDVSDVHACRDSRTSTLKEAIWQNDEPGVRRILARMSAEECNDVLNAADTHQQPILVLAVVMVMVHPFSSPSTQGIVAALLEAGANPISINDDQRQLLRRTGRTFQTPASELVLAMLDAAGDRRTLRTLCALPLESEPPRARRTM